MPKGAFYFFPKAPGGDDVAFVNKLLDERILAVPGSGFGGPGHFRLAFCVEDEVIARSAEGFKRARGSGSLFGRQGSRPFPAEPGKMSTGHSLFIGARWTDSGLPEGYHFPGLAISVPFNPIPPNASGLAAAFPRFSSPFKKTRGLPCVLEGYFKGLEATPEPPDRNVFPGGPPSLSPS